MKFLRASDLEWQEFKYALAAGVPPAGAFMVRGASKEITAQAQAMLEESFQAKYHTAYFLFSYLGSRLLLGSKHCLRIYQQLQEKGLSDLLLSSRRRCRLRHLIASALRKINCAWVAFHDGVLTANFFEPFFGLSVHVQLL